MEFIDVTLMKDGFLRDSVHPLENTDFGEALDKAVVNAIIKTIQDTPYLKEIAENLKMDLENGDMQMVEMDIKEAFLTVNSRPDKKSFYQALNENIKQEVEALYGVITDAVARELGLPDGGSLLALSKLERTQALKNLQEVKFKYGGETYNLSPSEVNDLFNLGKTYLKIDVGVRGTPPRWEMYTLEELSSRLANDEKDALFA